MIKVFKYLRAIHPISEELRDHLEDILKERKFKKKEYLLKAGQICNNLYFIDQGLIRGYYVKGSKEISYGFFKEREICVDADSFITQQYGNVNLQAIEDCIVYYITYAELQNIYDQFSEGNKIGRIVMEKCSVLQLQRFKAMWMQSAVDKYNWLCATFPDFHQRVPAKYLASYIGFTEAALSNVKNKKYSYKWLETS